MEELGKGLLTVLALILYSFLASRKKKKPTPPVPPALKTAPKTLTEVPRVKKVRSPVSISNPNPLFIPKPKSELALLSNQRRTRLRSRLDRNAVILAEILRKPNL